MANIIWTREAESWLYEIHEFIAQDSEKNADEVIRTIYEKVQLLRNNPLIGYHYKTTQEGEIRIILFVHYRIVYLTANGNLIYILGVFHGAMEIDRYL